MTLREKAAIAAMQGLITADELRAPREVALLAVEHADALVAKLGEGKAQALDLHMTDDDPATALTDLAVRSIQDHPLIRTEYVGLLQKAIAEAIRPTVDEWRKASGAQGTLQVCSTCVNSQERGDVRTGYLWCNVHDLTVHEMMCCPDCKVNS